MTEPTKIKGQRSESKNTVECRIAFPYVHEKRTKNAAGLPLKTGPRHDMTVLVPKLSADPTKCANYGFLSGLIMEAAGKMWPGHGWPQGANWPIKDGDVPYVSKPKPGVVPKTPEQIAAANAWRVGHWVIEVTNFLEPGPRVAIIQNGQVVPIPAKIVNGMALYKSGDFGIVNLHAYTYQNEQFGAAFGFDGVLFTRPGEPIGSSGPRSAEQMFGGVTVPNVPSAAPPQPGPAAYAPSPPLAPAAPAAPVYAPPAAPAAPAPAMAYAPPPGAPAPQPPAAPPAPPMPPMPPGAPGGLPPFPGPR